MSEEQWKALRVWLANVFPAEEAEAMFQEQVREAREQGLLVPRAVA